MQQASMRLFMRSETFIVPGEKINFSVIIRDRQWKSPGRYSCEIEISFAKWQGVEIIP